MPVHTEMSLASSDWFVCPTSRPNARLRLICFPFAGGGASTYVEWAEALPSAVEVQAVQLPGHESRIDEELLLSMEAVVRMLGDVIQPALDRPFAFFGHSLGALVGFELARALRRQGHPEPSMLFASGCRAPHVPPPEPPIHNLPDDEFAEEIQGFNGTPDEIFQSEELRALFLPVLRADLTIRETYEYAPEPPLHCPISAHGGDQDPVVDKSELEAWREQTNGAFNSRLYEGGHFYLEDHERRLVANVEADLKATGLLD